MAFPPFYRYPKFLTGAGDRLHPGMTLRGGGSNHFYKELRAGVLWRVSSPLGYPDVLHLVCVTQPDYFIRLNQPGERSWPPAANGSALGVDLARCLAPIPLSFWFSYERCTEWYDKFKALGCVLYAVDSDPRDHYVVVFAYCEELPAPRNMLTATISTLGSRGGRLWGEDEGAILAELYQKMRTEIDAFEAQRLRLAADCYSATLSWQKLGSGMILEPLPKDFKFNSLKNI